jgi:hypothetical protein
MAGNERVLRCRDCGAYAVVRRQVDTPYYVYERGESHRVDFVWHCEACGAERAPRIYK